MISSFVAVLLFCSPTRGDNRELVPLEAPANLTLVEIDMHQVLITWDPVDPQSLRGSFRGYLVRTWNDVASQVYAFPSDVTNANVEFFPFSKNFITVSVQNEKYVGPPSDAISFDAPQIEPNVPTFVKIFALGAKSVLIRWGKPTHPNGLLLGYKIYSSEIDNATGNAVNERKQMIEDPEKLQAKLTGMTEGVTYRMGVSAVNCAGESDIKTTQVQLEPHTPAEPFPSSFAYKLNYVLPGKEEVCGSVDEELGNATAKNETRCLGNCMVMWLPDVLNSPGEYFYVKFRVRGEKEFKTTEPEMSEDFVILSNFDACKNYEIGLTTVDGDYSTDSPILITPSALS